MRVKYMIGDCLVPRPYSREAHHVDQVGMPALAGFHRQPPAALVQRFSGSRIPVALDGGNLVDSDTTPVNFEDLTALLAAWTGPGPAGSPEAALGDNAVPEPSTLLLATLGLSFYRRRRRRAF